MGLIVILNINSSILFPPISVVNKYSQQGGNDYDDWNDFENS